MNIPAEQSLAALLVAPTRFLFFTGKGGVGKTSLACAAAIALADGGRTTLVLVSRAQRAAPAEAERTSFFNE